MSLKLERELRKLVKLGRVCPVCGADFELPFTGEWGWRLGTPTHALLSASIRTGRGTQAVRSRTMRRIRPSARQSAG